MLGWFPWFLAATLVGAALSSLCATLLNGDRKYVAPNSITLVPGSEYFKGNYTVEMESSAGECSGF